MRSLEKIIEKVLIHGKTYQPAMLPNELQGRRGRVGDCFDHTLVVSLTTEYKYVEGIAKRPTTGDWVLHAWLTDGQHAFDLTWGVEFRKGGVLFPLPTEYIGIEIDKEGVVDFLRAVKYKSVLHNGWRDEQRSEKLLGFNFK